MVRKPFDALLIRFRLLGRYLGREMKNALRGRYRRKGAGVQFTEDACATRVIG